MKTLLYRFSPDVLHSVYQRIEASPLGYRMAKGVFWSLAGSLIARGSGRLPMSVTARASGKIATFAARYAKRSHDKFG